VARGNHPVHQAGAAGERERDPSWHQGRGGDERGQRGHTPACQTDAYGGDLSTIGQRSPEIAQCFQGQRSYETARSRVGSQSRCLWVGTSVQLDRGGRKLLNVFQVRCHTR
jgi:hypothetical protein